MNNSIYSPKILKNLVEICAEMGVGKETIKQWVDLGAPIVVEMEGARTRYSSELTALMAWRLAYSRKKLGGKNG